LVSRVLTLRGLNTDSGSWTREVAVAGLQQFNVNNHILYAAMADCRAVKSQAEIECLRFAAKVRAM
jgi:Xaa-Pro dipeptidase